MRLLVLGGTRFVGRAVVESALGRDWKITVFNRGTRPAPAGVTTTSQVPRSMADQPPPGEAHDTLYQADVSKAVAAGLRCRPVDDTVADTWAWLQELGGRPPLGAVQPTVGLAPDVEARVLGVS